LSRQKIKLEENQRILEMFNWYLFDKFLLVC